jgi:hypothetical protein
VLRSVFAFLAAPVVGVAAGALVVAFVAPGSSLLVGGIYAAAGVVVAVAASVLLGLPTVLLARSGRAARLPSLLMVAVFAAPAAAFVAHCSHWSCLAGPSVSFLFAIVCGVVTAVVLHALLPPENALSQVNPSK